LWTVYMGKMARIRPDLVESAWNLVILAGTGETGSSKSGNGKRTLPNSDSSCQTLFFAFHNFFRASQTL
jgi:hypothetical protein